MDNSILIDVKKLLGIPAEETAFDQDIIIGINTAFARLTQLGVGPDEGFAIYDNSDSWTDFINDDKKCSMIKSYVYLSVQSVFDPPLQATVANSRAAVLDKLEWCIHFEAECGRL